MKKLVSPASVILLAEENGPESKGSILGRPTGLGINFWKGVGTKSKMELAMIAHQMLFSKAGIDLSYITLQQFLLSSWEEERIYSLLSPIFAIPTQPPTPQQSFYSGGSKRGILRGVRRMVNCTTIYSRVP
jgi:hypothetical protein